MAKRLDEATKKRLRAGRMLLAGKRPAEVAEKVGVARQTVYTWKGLLDEGGINALRAVPSRGRPAKLDASQLEGVRSVVLQSPTEHGFGTELWTLNRVGTVIERLYGVKFGTTQLWRILGALGFSVQKPEKRALERNEDTVRQWKRRTWPALKKSPAGRQNNRLCRRVRDQRTADTGADLGAERMHTGHPVPLQLESRLGHCRADAHQLPVPPARGEHQERTGCRVPEGTQVPPQTTIAGCPGWAEGTPQQIGARVSGWVERPYPVGIPASLCARPESGRIFVGLAQAARAGQLLPGESGRVACQRPQQAQERAKTPFDHRRLLDAGYALVMS